MTAVVIPLVPDDVTPERRAADLKQIRFPFRDVVLIVGTALAVASTQWAFQSSSREAQSEIKADVRVILEKIQGQKDLDAEKSKNQELRLQNVEEAIKALERAQQMQKFELMEYIKDKGVPNNAQRR